MVRSFARRALPVVAAAFVACGLIQVFLAGLGVFDDPASFVTHRNFGYLLGWFTLAMLVLALLGRQRRLVVGLTVLVLVQFTFQSVFVALRTTYPAVAALHPVNGFLLLVVGIAIARLSWVARHEPAGAKAPAAAPATDARPAAVEGG
jgi:mercuric ion transport protein